MCISCMLSSCAERRPAKPESSLPELYTQPSRSVNLNPVALMPSSSEVLPAMRAHTPNVQRMHGPCQVLKQQPYYDVCVSVWSGPVLSCPALSWPVLSCPVRSCPVRSWPVMSYSCMSIYIYILIYIYIHLHVAREGVSGGQHIQFLGADHDC